MNRARWYSSSITLLNGETYIQGGAGGTDRPEIRGTNGVFRLLSGANTSSFDFMYPRNFIAPDGRVFGFDSSGRMYYVNTSGTGSVTTAGQFSGPTGSDASAAMFRPGKILQFGGSSSSALVIDITGGAPVVSQTQQVSTQRRLVNATILADGRVLATGGSDVWNELMGVNNSAEIWNPSTGQWQVGPPGDGRACTTRRRCCCRTRACWSRAAVRPGPQNNTNVEVYYPSYLYNSSAAASRRARSSRAHRARSTIGQIFEVQMGGSQTVSRVVMVKTASVTHSWNMEQRFVELTFQQSGSRLRGAGADARGRRAARFLHAVRVQRGGHAGRCADHARRRRREPESRRDARSSRTRATRPAQAGTPVSLQLSATDPNGDSLILRRERPSSRAFHQHDQRRHFGNAYRQRHVQRRRVRHRRCQLATASPSPGRSPRDRPSSSTRRLRRRPAIAGTTVTFTASVTGGAGMQYRGISTTAPR